jgi:hypothetical protein
MVATFVRKDWPVTQAASEFGGDPGSIQPEPHQLTSVERARLERRVHSWDEGDSVEAARERELLGDTEQDGE